jgi:hypothetical protein
MSRVTRVSGQAISGKHGFHCLPGFYSFFYDIYGTLWSFRRVFMAKLARFQCEVLYRLGCYIRFVLVPVGGHIVGRGIAVRRGGLPCGMFLPE